MHSRIYTKTGDAGQTSLIGGTRVQKNNPKIKAYGTVDELNAFTGLLSTYPIQDADLKVLQEIQHKLFNIGANLATDLSRTELVNASVICDDDLLFLENEIDRMDATLPELRNFVLPGGSAAGAMAHVCRTFTRRAERRILDLNEQDDMVLKYINRLSDFFFVLSRYLTVNENKKEFLWKK